jgi:phosphoenolpyruvate carboxykinase (ATP)
MPTIIRHSASPTPIPAVRPRVSRRHANLSVPVLIEHALIRGEGRLSATGALAVATGDHTGRSPRDKFVVTGEEGEEHVWWGEINQPMAPAAFAELQSDVLEYLGEREHYRCDLHAGADPAQSMPVRVLTERAWCALFSSHLFLQGSGAPSRKPFTVLHAPGFHADPKRHETRSTTAIALSLEQRMVVICGTDYAGEIKKSVFTVLQAFLAADGIATMHCSANVGDAGDVALFFGLSGTGKTTLSTDGRRRLIGDDEHGWSDRGVFNFEGGSYAKTIGLSAAAEPQIYAAARTFGTVLENVVLDPVTREPDWNDDSLTENTRAAFPLSYLPGADPGGMGGHPRNLIFLSADAFGVLPPVAKLTPEQALYWYLTGYTSKLAGTEKGVAEPGATFSACFGSPFLPVRPERNAELLGERIRAHAPDVWMVNTGWSGGPAGVGERMPIRVTRTIVDAILDGTLAGCEFRPDPVFGFAIPQAIPGIPVELLTPRDTWSDPEACDRQARRLATDIRDNFRRFAEIVDLAVTEAGPKA